MSSLPASEPATAQVPPPLRDAIFISYRRDDARGASGRVYDWLKIGFGANAVFRDVHSIGVGRWRDRIDAALARCAACVAVIGPRWADATNLPRLHESGDMVRHELMTALASEAITMVPTLVENASLPGEQVKQLPEPLQPLFREWNVRTITENGWEDDIRRLIQEIGEATALPVQPDFQALLLSVAAAEQRIAGLEQEHRAQRDQLEASQRTIDELRGRLAEAPSGERDRLSEAFAALAQGNTRQAEAVFEREHAAALRTAVDAACHVGNLALLRDVGKAATYFGKVLQLDPEQPEASLQLSQARFSLGDLDGAEQAVQRGLELARARGDGRLELRALLGLGDGQLARGDGAAALTHNRQAVAIATALADQQPADSDRQRDLSVAHTKVGDALLAQGQPEAALESYRHSLAIRQKLAAQEPASSQAQRDLAIGLERIGEILLWQKDFDGAVDTSRRSLAIRDALVERDSGNSNAQLDLSIGHNKVGDALLARGDGGSALAAYTKALRIMEELVRADPGNSQWQRELAFCHNRRGEVLAAAGESEEALLAFRQGQAVAERLACLDPDNSLWQADLAFVFDRIGAAVQHHGDLEAALQHYQRALAIRSALVARDPETSPWLRDLFVSHLNVADSLTAQNNPEAARLSCRKALAIADQLLACAPDDPQTRFDRAEAGYKLSAAIAADPGSRGADAELLNSSREVVADLRASGWPMPHEAWLRAMEAEQSEPGTSERRLA
jgi:tetratricopeptide (TPR) repeat protein